MGKGNEASRIIGQHAGHLMRNIQHIAIQMLELQSICGMGHMAMHQVGSSKNCSDHFTKLLGPTAFEPHVH
jgi:hypothetical protein